MKKKLYIIIPAIFALLVLAYLGLRPKARLNSQNVCKITVNKSETVTDGAEIYHAGCITYNKYDEAENICIGVNIPILVKERDGKITLSCPNGYLDKNMFTIIGPENKNYDFVVGLYEIKQDGEITFELNSGDDPVLYIKFDLSKSDESKKENSVITVTGEIPVSVFYY